MNLRTLRESRGLTQRVLGERMRLSEVHVGLFEAGKGIPGAVILPLYAKALGVDEATICAAVRNTPRRRQARIINGHACEPCGRFVPSSARLEPGRAARGKRGRTVILPRPDYCADCACPLSAAARERAPKDGYIAFASASERRASASTEWVEHALP